LISHLLSSSASWCHMNCFSCPFLSLHSFTCQLKMHVNAHQCMRTAMRPAHASRRRKCRHGCVWGVSRRCVARRSCRVEETCASLLARESARSRPPWRRASRARVDKGKHGPVRARALCDRAMG
jgi:hypothetical protein